MRTFSIHQIRNVLIAIIAVLLIGATYFANSSLLRAPSAEAGTTENVTGWLWAENIGWISMNSITDGSGVSYGVDLDTSTKSTGGTGDFSGNGWSENVGWISFDRNRTGNPPSAPFNGGSGPIAQIDWSTGEVTGWMRVLSNGGGWDGWIKLSDDTVPSWSGSGVKISGNKFSGYAYAGEIIGWVDFSPDVNGVPIGAEISAPTCEATDPDITWGSCNPTVVCGASGYPEDGSTYTNVSGVRVGACLAGGTTVETCSSATLICPIPSGGTGTIKTHWWQF